MKLSDTVRRTLFGLHRLGLKFGMQILPAHYYTPVPNILELEKNRALWAVKSELPGLSFDLERQAASLRKICKPCQKEFAGNPYYVEGTTKHFGPGYGYIEAQALHGVVRHFKPKRILEVGSGVSTYCMTKASEMNQKEGGCGSKITSIEPYPSKALQELRGIELITKPVQAVSFDVFTGLEKGDFLFIDSSHTVKVGSDVNYLILEVLPRLRPGVLAHFHDIYLPYDYQPDALRTIFHWAETSLLRAFLTNNPKMNILFCLSHLQAERKEVLSEVFPEYKPCETSQGLFPENHIFFGEVPGHFPTSIYLETQ